MMRAVLLILAASVSFSIGQSAQTKVDFSGRWATEPAGPATSPAGGAGRARGGVAGDMGSGWGSPVTITQDARQLTVDYAFFGRGDMQPPLKFVYALDGSETRNSVMMGRGVQVQVSKTAWDADKLVIRTTHSLADPATGKPITVEVTQALSLESPTSLIVETTRAGVLGGQSSTTKTVYKKQ